MLALLMERLSRAKTLDGIVLAITDQPADDPLQAFCEAHGFKVFRGDEHDVLARFEGAARACAPDAETIVRITSDCPLLDPEIVDAQVGWFLENRASLDYASVGKTPKLPNGASVEAFSRAALARAFAEAASAYDREHVTPYIQRAEAGFRVGETPVPLNAPEYRLSVDTPEDLALVSAVFDALYPANPAFSLADVIAYLDAHPQVKAINAHVVQTTGPYVGKAG